jgi:hypothetical protein
MWITHSGASGEDASPGFFISIARPTKISRTKMDTNARKYRKEWFS